MNVRFESFTTMVVTLNRYLQKIKDIEMKKFGLRANHTMCLYYLGQHDEGLTATELTNLCREDKAAISRTVSQLMEKELIFCDIPENKRSYRTRLFLTPKGRELNHMINDRIAEILTNAGSGLSDSDRQTFYESMKTITDNLEMYFSEEDKK